MTTIHATSPAVACSAGDAEELRAGAAAIGAAEFELAIALRRFACGNRSDLVAEVRLIFDEAAALRARLGIEGRTADRQQTSARAWAYASGIADGTLLTLDMIEGRSEFPDAAGYTGPIPDELRSYLAGVRCRAEAAAAIRSAAS